MIRVASFPKLKMKPKELHFERVPDIQWELQAALHSIKENDLYDSFEAWKK
jgi:hypothetical protein